MAGEASFRISAGIDDELAAASTYFQVKAPGAMTRFAPLTLPGFPFARNLNTCVSRVFEVLNDLLVAESACFCPDVLSTLNHGRWGDHALHRRAGNNKYHCCGSRKPNNYKCSLELRLLHNPPRIFINWFIPESRLFEN